VRSHRKAEQSHQQQNRFHTKDSEIHDARLNPVVINERSSAKSISAEILRVESAASVAPEKTKSHRAQRRFPAGDH
jgi:hypothetical protein